MIRESSHSRGELPERTSFNSSSKFIAYQVIR
jgi:hypothetical protein